MAGKDPGAKPGLSWHGSEQQLAQPPAKHGETQPLQSRYRCVGLGAMAKVDDNPGSYRKICRC